MNFWVALAIFLISVLDDILYVFFVRRVMQGSKFTAALLSGILTALVSVEGYAQFVVHPGYIVVNSMGSAVGCPVAMLLEDWLPKRKPPRNKKTGRFKPIPATSQFQRGDKT
jgi:hypothetical protein